MLAKRLFVLFAPLALLVSACGAPEYAYVKNSEQQLYFKVPRSWQQLDQEAVDEWATAADPDSATAKVRDQLMWTVAYDAADEPDLDHLTTIAAASAPVVWAKVERLLPDEGSKVSLDWMRDYFLPVTDDSREAAAQVQALLPGFELLHDEVLTPERGLHGVRVVYNYSLRDRLQTFDLTTLVNDDASLLYMLFIRCSARCYNEHAEQVQDVVASFTVRS